MCVYIYIYIFFICTHRACVTLNTSLKRSQFPTHPQIPPKQLILRSTSCQEINMFPCVLLAKASWHDTKTYKRLTTNTCCKRLLPDERYVHDGPKQTDYTSNYSRRYIVLKTCRTPRLCSPLCVASLLAVHGVLLAGAHYKVATTAQELIIHVFWSYACYVVAATVFVWFELEHMWICVRDLAPIRSLITNGPTWLCTLSCTRCVSASGEAILGSQR